MGSRETSGPRGLLLSAALVGACGRGTADTSGPVCLDPPRGPAVGWFTDVTRASGIDFQYTSNDFKGGGLAVVDLDGDGRPDIVAGLRDGGVTVYRNLGALRFAPITPSGIDPARAATAIGAGDLDNDGDRDLVLASAGTTYVMANQGDGTFREAARIADAGMTEHVLLTDIDGDGLLDLYLGNYDIFTASNSLNRLYRNRGGLQFTLAASVGEGLSWATTAFDVDGDGDQDLYVANDTQLVDYGVPSTATSPLPADLLLRNDGVGPDGMVVLTDIAAERGLAKQRSSMGGVLGDLDEDGRLDLYVPDFGANKLFTRDAAGTYVDRAAELGITATARINELCPDVPQSEDCALLTWSTVISDFDGDGYDELLLVNGETSPLDPPPVVVFTRGPELPYREVAAGIPCMDARGVVATDLDGDGDPDVVIAQKEGPLTIYENRTKVVAGSSMTVALRGRASNRDGVGAVVTVHLASGRVVTKIVGAGGVIHTASPAEVHVGLGGDGVESIDVLWPSGRRSQVIRPTDRSLAIDEGS